MLNEISLVPRANFLAIQIGRGLSEYWKECLIDASPSVRYSPIEARQSGSSSGDCR
jgi:hypothetical protein